MKILVALLTGTLLTACSQGPDSTRGFSLPEGNAELGRQVFLANNCLACHSLKGFEQDSAAQELDTLVKLGGDVAEVKTYADLVTSVINPSHKIAKGYAATLVSDDQGNSLMRNYNQVMTVDELVNLITFLQPHYKLKAYDRTSYPTYFP